MVWLKATFRHFVLGGALLISLGFFSGVRAMTGPLSDLNEPEVPETVFATAREQLDHLIDYLKTREILSPIDEIKALRESELLNPKSSASMTRASLEKAKKVFKTILVASGLAETILNIGEISVDTLNSLIEIPPLVATSSPLNSAFSFTGNSYSDWRTHFRELAIEIALAQARDPSAKKDALAIKYETLRRDYWRWADGKRRRFPAGALLAGSLVAGGLHDHFASSQDLGRPSILLLYFVGGLLVSTLGVVITEQRLRDHAIADHFWHVLDRAGLKPVTPIKKTDRAEWIASILRRDGNSKFLNHPPCALTLSQLKIRFRGSP